MIKNSSKSWHVRGLWLSYDGEAFRDTVTTHQYDYLCFGKTRDEQLSDSKNPSCDLLCCVFVIVGSYPQHRHLDQTTDTSFTFTQHTVSSKAEIRSPYTLKTTKHASGPEKGNKSQDCCVDSFAAFSSQRYHRGCTLCSVLPLKRDLNRAERAALTLGRMFSSSPFCSRHSTLQVVSPPMPKLSAWRGENSSLHTCG